MCGDGEITIPAINLMVLGHIPEGVFKKRWNILPIRAEPDGRERLTKRDGGLGWQGRIGMTKLETFIYLNGLQLLQRITFKIK